MCYRASLNDFTVSSKCHHKRLHFFSTISHYPILIGDRTLNIIIHFTDHQEEIIGKVVEVKANEIMRDSGRLRHPRFLRVRHDKEPDRCTWADHIGSSI